MVWSGVDCRTRTPENSEDTQIHAYPPSVTWVSFLFIPCERLDGSVDG